MNLLLFLQDKLDEALEMGRKALAIEERVYPAGHPRIGQSVNNLAGMLESKVSVCRLVLSR